MFSHWHGAVCAASTQLGLSEASRLAEMLTSVLRRPAAVGRDGGQ